MNILALDTSMGACSAALLALDGAARTLVLREASMARGHAEALMPMVAEVMQESGLGFADLDLVAATVGPGSFTGLRIAIAAARGLALVTKAKLFGTDSLSVMASRALASGTIGPAPFAVAVDAKRDRLYLGLYDEAAATLQGPLLIAPEQALQLLPSDLRMAAGSGAELLAAAGARHGRVIASVLPELQPNAAALAEIAAASGETVPVLKPLYLRPPDARPQAPAVSRR
jgi:tRNA threonylcarbamoyladenosine biosynthesis protein TsaB